MEGQALVDRFMIGLAKSQQLSRVNNDSCGQTIMEQPSRIPALDL
jgi:hypothetical protein